MERGSVRQIMNVLATLAVIVINVLANALPLNGQNTGEISDRFSVYFVPAGYVFSIWGLIYLGLIGFAIYQALPGQRDNHRLRRLDYPYVVASLANIAWIFLWHYEVFPLTMVAMLLLLAGLIVIYLQLSNGKAAAPSREKWLVQVPFSIYLGWITVATIANATALLAYWNWDGWGISAVLWTIIMLLAATIIAILIALTRRDIAYLLVLAWAFIGITVRHSSTTAVAISAAVAALIVLAAAFLVWQHRPSNNLARI